MPADCLLFGSLNAQFADPKTLYIGMHCLVYFSVGNDLMLCQRVLGCCIDPSAEVVHYNGTWLGKLL